MGTPKQAEEGAPEAAVGGLTELEVATEEEEAATGTCLLPGVDGTTMKMTTATIGIGAHLREIAVGVLLTTPTEAPITANLRPSEINERFTSRACIVET